MRKTEQRGTILMYAILLVNFAVILGYILFLKSQTLLENTRFAEMSGKLSKNIEERGMGSIEYDLQLNGNGSGFVNSTACPLLSFSGSSSGSTYSESIPTSPVFDGALLYCSGSSVAFPGQNALLTYAPDFLSFSGIAFRSSYSGLSGGGTLTGKLNDADESFVSLVLSGSSGLDANFNSDDYRYCSTGSVGYPNGFMDDDDLARKISFGYVRKDNIWRNVFWNTPEFAKRIRNNANNTGALALLPDQTGTGILHLDLDGSYRIKIVEFDAAAYAATKELRIRSTVSTGSLSGAIGYLQANLSVATGSSNAMIFDLKNKNYGIFLTDSGSLGDFLKYRFYFANQSGSLVYTVPIDDSDPDRIAYYGNDLIIDSDNQMISKEEEIIRPK